MNNHADETLKDEIDLNKLILKLWHGKLFIIMLSVLAVFLASWHLQTVEYKYTVEYKLKPVGESKNTSSSISGLSGIASFAGIQLPSRSNNDIKIYKELITSAETSEIIFKNVEIIKDVFKSEWNASLNTFISPPKSKIQSLISDFKKLLTGNRETDYIPPDPRRLAIFISKNINISEDKETGFLRLTSVTSNPELLLSLIIEATSASDKIMRQNYIDFSTKPLDFYKEKIRTSRSREHRLALAELIGVEEQKLMFASRGKYFIAEPYLNPTISLYPTSPKPKIILILSILLGFFIGSATILFRSIFVKVK
jgi:uncharacterized protein involved in exopolysaccharide biosynthesis